MERLLVGDKVALRKEYLEASERDVSCAKVIRDGAPNEFVVAESHVLSGVEAVTLSPCCGRSLDAAGVPLCAAHPAALFELISRGSPERAAVDDALDALFRSEPKRFFSVDAPLLGPLVHFGHYDDGKCEGLAVRVAGAKPFLIAGKDLESVAGFLAQGKSLVDLLMGKKR